MKTSPSSTRRMMATAGLLAWYVVAVGALAQSPSPTFEVASIKPNKSGELLIGMSALPNGRVNITNTTVKALIRTAYRLQEFQVVGGPDWLPSERYDVVAKAEGNPDREHLERLLQGLLAERFKLSVHRDTKDLPIYALTAAKRDGTLGPQLQKSSIDCAAVRNGPPRPSGTLASNGGRPVCGMRGLPGNFIAGGIPLALFATSISTVVNRTVVDRTGLAGDFDIDLRYTPDQMPQLPLALPGGATLPPIDPNGPSIFTAVQEQLGLKLESTRGPVEVLVIDNVDHPTLD